ncbi:MAG: hypothetical protein ACFFAU_17560, partial [Candidatus Hodarchaeota archaeon]
KRIIAFFIMFHILISSVVIIQQEYTDYRNIEFINKIHYYTEENSVILSVYYDKLIHNRTTFRYEISPGKFRQDTFSVISYLINKSVPVYFIPDAIASDSFSVKELKENTNLNLIYNGTITDRNQIGKFSDLLLDYPRPRILYKIDSIL